MTYKQRKWQRRHQGHSAAVPSAWPLRSEAAPWASCAQGPSGTAAQGLLQRVLGKVVVGEAEVGRAASRGHPHLTGPPPGNVGITVLQGRRNSSVLLCPQPELARASPKTSQRKSWRRQWHHLTGLKGPREAAGPGCCSFSAAGLISCGNPFQLDSRGKTKEMTS